MDRSEFRGFKPSANSVFSNLSRILDTSFHIFFKFAVSSWDLKVKQATLIIVDSQILTLWLIFNVSDPDQADKPKASVCDHLGTRLVNQLSFLRTAYSTLIIDENMHFMPKQMSLKSASQSRRRGGAERKCTGGGWDTNKTERNRKASQADHRQQRTSRSLCTYSIMPASWVRASERGELAQGSVTSMQNLARGFSARVRVPARGDWATRTAIASHFKCHLGGDITTVETLARSHPVGAAVAWIKVTGCVLFLPSTIMVAVISRQAVREVFPRRPRWCW